MVGCANFLSISGVVEKAPVSEGEAFNPIARFTVVLRHRDVRGMPLEVKLQVIAIGSRARECLAHLGAGSRVAVYGKLVLIDGVVGAFAEWVEFVTGSTVRKEGR